jgi:putative flippase GtrA
LTVLAFGVGATAAFVVNERVTFKDKSRSKRKKEMQAHWFERWGKFQLACLLGNVIIVMIQLSLLATISLSPAFGHIIGSAVTYPITYIISSHFVWEIRPFR